MMFLLKNIDIKFGEGLLFSIFAIFIVFVVLALLVVLITLLSKIKFKEEKKEEVKAPVVSEAKKKFTIDDIKDEDMMVAALVATADFIEETKKTDARVVSIKQIG